MIMTYLTKQVSIQLWAVITSLILKLSGKPEFSEFAFSLLMVGLATWQVNQFKDTSPKTALVLKTTLWSLLFLELIWNYLP